MYSVFSALALFFVIFVVPETKGRDLEDIAKLFVKKRRSVSIAASPMLEKKPSIPTVTGLINEGFKQSTTNVNGIRGHDSDITKL